MLQYLMKSAVRSVIRSAENSFNTPERKGARGERLVQKALTSVLDEKDYRVVSDLILPVAEGTTQIDHVVLSRFGIFVIETKNMSGWIFGSADQPKWTQLQKGGKRRSFQNPLRQNYAHVLAVQDILGVEPKIVFNFVVFTGAAEPKTEMPENVVWGLHGLGKLFAVRKQLVLSDSQMHAYAHKLQTQSLENTKAVLKEHIKNLEKKAASQTHQANQTLASFTEETFCPKCGGQMLKRSNRKTGDAFWGCAKFPKCRGTRKAL